MLKRIAALVLYGIGHVLSKVIWHRRIYLAYNWCMVKSGDLDSEGRIWK